MCTRLMDRTTGSSRPRHDRASLKDSQNGSECSDWEPGPGRCAELGVAGRGTVCASVCFAAGACCAVSRGANWEGIVTTEGKVVCAGEGAMVATMADSLSSFLSKSRNLLGVWPSPRAFAGRRRATCSTHSTLAFWHLGEARVSGCGEAAAESGQDTSGRCWERPRARSGPCACGIFRRQRHCLSCLRGRPWWEQGWPSWARESHRPPVAPSRRSRWCGEVRSYAKAGVEERACEEGGQGRERKGARNQHRADRPEGDTVGHGIEVRESQRRAAAGESMWQREGNEIPRVVWASAHQCSARRPAACCRRCRRCAHWSEHPTSLDILCTHTAPSGLAETTRGGHGNAGRLLLEGSRLDPRARRYRRRRPRRRHGHGPPSDPAPPPPPPTTPWPTTPRTATAAALQQPSDGAAARPSCSSTSAELTGAKIARWTRGQTLRLRMRPQPLHGSSTLHAKARCR